MHSSPSFHALLSIAVLEAAAAFSPLSYSQRGIWPHHGRGIPPTSQPRRCRIGRSTTDPWRVRSGSEGALGRPQVSSSVEASAEWWEVRGAVPFSCTECGKCCQVKGDVWASPEDATRLAEHLGVDLKTLSEIYGKREVEGWIQMKDKPEGGCIFLADDGKACGVYEGRPVQCRVYPFFPRILKTPEAWNGEVVDAPDAEAPVAGRVWAADTGGCEGMGEVKDVRWNKKKGMWKAASPQGNGEPSAGQEHTDSEVSASRIREQLMLYENTFWKFPHEALMQMSVDSRTADQAAADRADVQASIDALLNTMPRAHKSTTAPSPTQSSSPSPLGGEPQFYDQLLALSGMVDRDLQKMRDSSDTDTASSAAESGAHEAQSLAAEGEGRGDMAGCGEEDMRRLVIDWAIEHVVRLGLCPFAAAVVDSMRVVVSLDVTDETSARELFVREARYMMGRSEEEVPTTILALPNLLTADFMAWNFFTEELAEDLEEGGALEHIGDDVLIAAFHPHFEFGGLEEKDDVLNFEKRAPLPMINLLRTEAIDRGIDEGITADSIHDHNEEVLRAEGLDAVRLAFMAVLHRQRPNS